MSSVDEPTGGGPALHVALHDGFEGWGVEVRVNGRDVYGKDEVWTDPRIGLADSIDVDTADRPATVEVRVPDLGITGSVTVVGRAMRYLGVSIEGGMLRFRQSAVPFGYA